MERSADAGPLEPPSGAPTSSQDSWRHSELSGPSELAPQAATKPRTHVMMRFLVFMGVFLLVLSALVAARRPYRDPVTEVATISDFSGEPGSNAATSSAVPRTLNSGSAADVIGRYKCRSASPANKERPVGAFHRKFAAQVPAPRAVPRCGARAPASRLGRWMLQ